jgi:uncharacterized protein (DUF1330 family)
MLELAINPAIDACYGTLFLIFREPRMSAYLVVEVEITDPAQYDEYRQKVPATLEKYRGRFVVRGGDPETLEGKWSPKRIVVLEFPDRATARSWWSSAEYAPAKAQRQRAARTQMILVDGV